MFVYVRVAKGGVIFARVDPGVEPGRPRVMTLSPPLRARVIEVAILYEATLGFHTPEKRVIVQKKYMNFLVLSSNARHMKDRLIFVSPRLGGEVISSPCNW